MAYQFEASTVTGFVQQLAVGYVARGYWFYVTGRVPERKDPLAVDAKLIKKYAIDQSKWARARRKKAGVANLQYLRHDRFFIIVATHGEHAFFWEEPFKDARRAPVRFAGYSISYRGGHALVRLDRETYKNLKGHFLDLAMRRSVSSLAEELGRIPFEPYCGVRRQVLNIHRAVNRARQQGGLAEVPVSALRLQRRVVKVFV